MMELQIYSPGADGFPEIKWNHEELKIAVIEAIRDYSNLAITPESEKDGKEIRARLNKLRTSLEDARKDMKKRVTAPLKVFEEQIKSVEMPIDKAIEGIDRQLKEIDDLIREKKEQEVKEIFEHFTKLEYFPEFLTLEQVWNPKWLNRTVNRNTIIMEIDDRIKRINSDLKAMMSLPYGFEAAEYYKKSLNLTEAMAKAQEHAKMEEAKAQAERERAEKPEPEKIMPTTPQNEEKKPVDEPETVKPEKTYTFRFEVSLTKAQAQALGAFCRDNGIMLKKL